MTENMRHLIVSLRVVIAMFGFNVGMTFASFAYAGATGAFVSLICTFVCACCWFIVERRIKQEGSL